jgi:hypothetical protein
MVAGGFTSGSFARFLHETQAITLVSLERREYRFKQRGTGSSACKRKRPTVKLARKKPETARKECEEALKIYEPFAKQDPEQFLPYAKQLETLLKQLPR